MRSPRSSLWRWLRRILLTLLVALLALVAAFFYLLPPRGVFLTDSWQFKEKRDGPVIGNLGGVPVRIPTEFAHFVEYDGDPGFLEKRQGPIPTRTQQSRIRSFGFDVLYPEMLGLTPETQSKGYHDNIYLSMWVHVGIESGERYFGDHSLKNLEPPLSDPKRWKFPLLQRKQPLYDLTVYESQGGDTSDIEHVTIYTHHSAGGEMDVYIRCFDAPHPAAPCNLQASLNPAMQADITVHFRKGLLPQWADILTHSKAKVLAFSNKP